MRSYREDAMWEIRSELSSRIGKAAFNIEGAAKSLCPVASGRLKGSITNAPANGTKTDYSDGAVIGTNVYYAPFVELGTRDSLEQPFLVPAFVHTIETTRDFLEGKI